MTQQKKEDPQPVTRGGWAPVGTGARRREAHAKRSRPRGRERRNSIVTAAREIFEELGYEPARVEDIVDRAEVSRGTFYTYFESKLDLFREVTDQALADIEAAVTARVPAEIVGTAARLSWTNQRYLEVYAENARLMGLLEHVAMVDDYIHDRRLAARRANVSRVAGQVNFLQEQGRANPELEPFTSARLLVSMLSNFAYWSFAGGDDYDAVSAGKAVSSMWLGAIGFTETARPGGGAQTARSAAASVPATRKATPAKKAATKKAATKKAAKTSTSTGTRSRASLAIR